MSGKPKCDIGGCQRDAARGAGIMVRITDPSDGMPREVELTVCRVHSAAFSASGRGYSYGDDPTRRMMECPCEDGLPDPCTLCGADAKTGICAL